MSSVGRYWENIILAVGKVQRHTCEYAETGVDLMKRKELIVAVVLALICLVIFGGGAFAAEPAKQIAYWGIYTGNAGGQGVAVEGVMGASAAQAAGLQKGDVLLSINGVAVRSPQEFTILKNTFPLYTPLKLAIKRAGATVELQIEVSGIVPLEVKPVKTEFIIPGVPAAPEAKQLSAMEALDQINVLDKVVLEPASGKIAIIGHWDDHFNTGSIPYLDLLKTAMVYPKPVFNLHNTPEVDKSLNSQPFPKWRLEQFIIGHPDADQDRQNFIREWAKLCSLSPEELVTVYNYVKFTAKGTTPPADIRPIQSKLLANLGYVDSAQAYDLLNQGGADPAVRALQTLAQDDEAKTILAKNGGDAIKAAGELTAAVYLAILKKINVETATIASLRSALSQGHWQEVIAKAQGELFPSRKKDDERDLVMVALTKVMVQANSTAALYGLPFNGQTVLDPVDLDRTSQLARIMYEADYSLKSTMATPHLFRHIAGSMTQQEYLIHKGFMEATGATTTFWIMPKHVAMEISPERRVVTFGTAEMLYNSFTAEDKNTPGGIPGEDKVDRRYDEWCAGVMNNYDEYARILPAFHKIREVAKIIALANWLLAEKINVDLSGVSQEKWDAPDKVLGFLRTGQLYRKLQADAPYQTMTLRAYSGGVSFKPKGNWTSYTPAPVSETKVFDQLTLSAGLGQKAVQAAQDGNMEKARYLAEISAQAMTGKLSKADLPQLNVTLPEPKQAQVAVSPAHVQLQKEMIKKTYQQIAAGGSIPSAKITLTQLDNLYNQLRDNPAAASDYLVKLQTGQLPPPSGPKPDGTPPTPAVAKSYGPVCSQNALDDASMTAEDKAKIAQRLVTAREKLHYINQALKNLMAINAQQQAELNKWTTEIDQAYKECKDRFWDAMSSLLLDAGPDKIKSNYEEVLQSVDGLKAAWLAKAAAETDPNKLVEIQKNIDSLNTLGQSLTDTNRLIKNYQDTKLFADVDKGNSEAENLSKQLKNAVGGIAQLALSQPWLKEALDAELLKRSGKTFDFFSSLYTVGQATYYASSFFYDIVRQQFAWQPVMTELQKSMAYNTQAMDKLRQDAARTSQEIGCLEKLLLK